MHILITGANGLLGRIFAKHLAGQNHTIVGIDQAALGTPSMRFILDQAETSPLLKEAFTGKYFKLDITDKNKLLSLLDDIGKIDVVIHLAGLMETAPIEFIKKVNFLGTENIYSCCKIKGISKIIYASSIQTISGKLRDDLYRNIHLGIFQKDLDKIPKIDANCRCLPEKTTDSMIAYIESKYFGEDTARSSVKDGLSTICLRFGAISSNNTPYSEPELLPIWCSHQDACRGLDHAIDKLVNTDDYFTRNYYVCSSHPRLWLEMNNDMNFVPEDNAEKTLAHNKESSAATFSLFNSTPHINDSDTPKDLFTNNGYR